MPELGEIKRAWEIGKGGRGTYIWHACELCGKQRWVQLYHQERIPSKRCLKCANIGHHQSEKTKAILSECHKGPKSASWKGGRWQNIRGYVLVLLEPTDFFYPMARTTSGTRAGRYVLEHRLVMAKYLKQHLLPWEIVHHKNGNRSDNRIENLELLPSSFKHASITKLTQTVKRLQEKVQKQEQEIKLLKWQCQDLRQELIKKDLLRSN